ncbi:hypothetical protein Cs7R123_05750 [Catellatospora sp. TT07R-123]|nr:hypothetical protein Cs7R123_05750 [Catellatospora sp. TT07R-123]
MLLHARFQSLSADPGPPPAEDPAELASFERALQLYRALGDKPTWAEALRHLGIAAHAAGRLDEARERLGHRHGPSLRDGGGHQCRRSRPKVQNSWRTWVGTA